MCQFVKIVQLLNVMLHSVPFECTLNSQERKVTEFIGQTVAGTFVLSLKHYGTCSLVTLYQGWGRLIQSCKLIQSYKYYYKIAKLHLSINLCNNIQSFPLVAQQTRNVVHILIGHEDYGTHSQAWLAWPSPDDEVNLRQAVKYKSTNPASVTYPGNGSIMWISQFTNTPWLAVLNKINKQK